MPTLKRKLPPCCATFNFHFFCFSITNTLACHPPNNPSVSIQTFSRFVGALVAPISRGNGACIQIRRTLLPNQRWNVTKLIHARIFFVVVHVDVCKAWTLTRWYAKRDRSVGSSFSRRVWKRVKRVVSTDRGQIWEGKAYENWGSRKFWIIVWLNVLRVVSNYSPLGIIRSCWNV